MNKQIIGAVIISMALLGGCAGNNVKTMQHMQEAQPIPSSKIKIIDIPHAKNPLPNVLTGGQPTPAHIEQAQAAGYKTIINLRMPGENGTWDEASKAAELGMTYISIPIAGRDGLSKDNASALMAAIQKHSDEPVMVHCGSGNRIGALFAIDAKFNQNKTTEEAMDVGAKSGLTSFRVISSDGFV